MIPSGARTGQVLALARSTVVDEHSGTIAVESEVGIGATFVVRLPLRPKGDAPPNVET